MIISDIHEPEKISKRCDIIRNLPKGDYWVCGRGKIIKVERKTLSDLHNTVRSKRLNQQLEGVDILLVERNQFVPNGIYGLLSSEHLLDIIDGIAVHHIMMFSNDLNHTYKILRRTEKNLRNGTYGEMRREVRIIGLEDPREAVIAQLPGVGQELASRILKRYGTLQLAFEDISNWKDVPGLGPRKVDAIRTFYEEEEI